LDEVEKFFKCPYCHERISMILDVSNPEPQVYIEDCEVCCHPIQVSYVAEQGKIKGFQAEKIN